MCGRSTGSTMIGSVFEVFQWEGLPAGSLQPCILIAGLQRTPELVFLRRQNF